MPAFLDPRNDDSAPLVQQQKEHRNRLPVVQNAKNIEYEQSNEANHADDDQQHIYVVNIPVPAAYLQIIYAKKDSDGKHVRQTERNKHHK